MNSQKRLREKRKQQYEYAKILVKKTNGHLVSSHFMKNISEAKNNGHTDMTIMSRTSSPNKQKQKLRHQTAGIRNYIEQYDLVEKSLFSGRESAKSTNPYERPLLVASLDDCRANDTSLLIASPSRALRNEDFHPIHNPDAQYTEEEQDALIKLAVGVSAIYCLVGPDTTPQEDEAFLIKLALSVSDKNYEEEPTRKAVCLPLAISLREKGFTLRDIARKLEETTGFSVNHEMVRRWLISYRNS